MELVMFALAASAIAGTIGNEANATLVLYTVEPAVVKVNSQEYVLRANETRTVNVPLQIKNKRELKHIIVETKTLRANLPITVFGDLPITILAPLFILPVACFIAAVRVRKYEKNSLFDYEITEQPNEKRTSVDNS